jgi:hypothetical protein
MAILSFYQCQIMVDGVALREYDDDDDDTDQKSDQSIPTVVKYVQATSGAEFSVNFSLLKDWKVDQDLVWKIYLDGTFSQSSVIANSTLYFIQHSWNLKGLSVGRGDEWYLKKYKFADIITGKLRSLCAIFWLMIAFRRCWGSSQIRGDEGQIFEPRADSSGNMAL